MIALPRVPWTPRDIAAAIGFNLTASYAIGTAALLVEEIADGANASEALSYAITSIALMAVAIGIGAVSGIRVMALVNVIGIAMSLAIAIQVASGIEGDGGNFAGLPTSVFQSAIFSSMFLAAAWLYGSVKYRSSKSDFGFVQPQGRLPYLLAIGAWGLSLIAITLWSILTEELGFLQQPDNTSDALEMAGGSLLVALPLVGIFVPFAEEVFFRGFLLAGLRRRMSPYVALFVSAAIFAVFHILPGLYVPIFILGTAMGWVYLKTGSIWPCILVHAAQNSLALILTWQDVGS